MSPASPFSQLSGSFRVRRPAAALLSATVLFCFALNGCSGDYCIIGIFNPTGIVTGTNNPCVNNKVMGNVSVRFTAAAAPADGPMAANLLHIFVTVQGIEAHPNAVANEDSPDWEELAPDIVRKPVQIDLLAHPASSCATNPIAGALIAAGAYRQIRLRLAPGHPTAVEAVPAQNACGELGFHCAISPDGHIHPLAFVGGVTNLHVAADRISGGFFHVLPDTDTHLTIEFNPFSSFATSSGNTVQLNPIFTMDTATLCGTAMTSEQ